ncbi:ATP-binding protein [Streptomyces sp. NPDC008139]|uniref:ATP-binding protein n=1 Tax=Streptomyces sp. NPDC008139 TaxID=3364814 RepID=UPI0036EEF99A
MQWKRKGGAVRVNAVYRGESADIAAARDLVTVLFTELERASAPVAARAVGDVLLVVSELVTNAVKYTEGPCGLGLHVTGGVLRIEVWDTSTTPVTVMGANPDRVGRHGLEIVTALCGGFKTAATATGKLISVEMPVPRADA